ncbi:hypothetical protein C8P66_1105 [Humitalea rosea]|uniref:AbrB family transcriptional regulator n=2 Tax=Humitalea rosea TaxID=990373 RepID=A0A2W7IIH1_9PROT|nr:hypothetical protein C8P66_1105 [Humitalea rosea]
MRSQAAQFILGALIGGAGGAVFAWLHMPLAWLTGSLLAVAAARFAGLPAEGSRQARNALFGIIGIALGAYFTPATAALLTEKLPLVLVAALASLGVGAALAPLLARVGRVDMATAWFSSIPGGVADMALLADSYGGRAAPVAVTQLLRICFVVILVPNAFALFGFHAEHPWAASPLPFLPLRLLLLYCGGLAAALLLVRVGVRVGWLLGPLVVTATLTASGVPLSGVPPWLTAIAQVALGASLGTGFGREALRSLRRFLPAAILHVVALMTCCALVGMLLGLIWGESLGTMLLGTAPGGVAEMSLTAKTLGFDVALVVILHVTRIFLVSLITPLFFRVLHRRSDSGT